MLSVSKVLRYAQPKSTNSWSQTLQLPKTSFPARPDSEKLFDLRQRCSSQLYNWQKQEGRPRTTDDGRDNVFVLHDGPPYANGPVHVGHALNKILKDVILRVNLSRGKQVHYKPGWDCHGLPIELKALKAGGEGGDESLQDRGKISQLGSHNDALDIRRRAKALAEETVSEQSEAFQSWGVMGEWEKPYLTMDKGFEIRQLNVFKDMVAKGLIHRQNKPVYWSPSSQTALAEAELEYMDNHKVRAAYVRFPITKLSEGLKKITCIDSGRLSALIWTTTLWTLPANTAIGIRSDLVYSIIESEEHGQMIVARELVADVQRQVPEMNLQVVVEEISGQDLLDTEYINVLSDKTSRVIHGDFITSTSGTGLVHMAAGHGMEDYTMLKKAGFVEVFAPVDKEGKFTDEALPSNPSRLKGLYVVTKGAQAVLELLKDRSPDVLAQGYGQGSLIFKDHAYTHRSPIDWRTKRPVIVRATNQWFADVANLQEPALASLKDVQFVPDSGKTRLETFLKGRQEWCISRQRAWGVPIPALYNKDSGEAFMTPESIAHIVRIIEQRGVDAWWSDKADDPSWWPSILPSGSYERGKDTLDVWFDSGTTWTMLGAREASPLADIYVEGTDQHRGWFQSSVLTHVASQDLTKEPVAPFKKLITHGFTLDANGHKMSKSLGNVITPLEILQGVLHGSTSGKGRRDMVASQTSTSSPFGPDVLRLWVASSDYSKDVTISQASVSAIHQAFGKYRVTFKWLLGVLNDFPDTSPEESARMIGALNYADALVMQQLCESAATVHAAQNEYDFAKAVKEINRFINHDLSAGYFEVIKDRLYAGDEQIRLHTQSILFIILDELLQMLAPICPLLVEEVWQHYPVSRQDQRVHPHQAIYEEPTSLISMDQRISPELIQQMQNMTSAIKIAQEDARRSGRLGSGLACGVEILLPQNADEDFKMLVSDMEAEDELADQLLVSHVEVLPMEDNLRRAMEDQEDKEEDGLIKSIIMSKREWRNTVPWEYEADFNCGTEDSPVPGMIKLLPPAGKKCQRCWKYTVTEMPVLEQLQDDDSDDDEDDIKGPEALQLKELQEEYKNLQICDRCSDVLGIDDSKEAEVQDEMTTALVNAQYDKRRSSLKSRGNDQDDNDNDMDDILTGRELREKKKRKWRKAFRGRS